MHGALRSAALAGTCAIAMAAPAAVAPAAERIAIARDDGGIALVDPAGRTIRTLTRHAGWVDTDPAWSPDGGRIAFTRTRDGGASFQVYVMRADGRRARRITRGRFDWRPAWSPDGRWIAYQSTSGLRRVRPDGTGARRIPTPDAVATEPSWTPAGRISYAWHAEQEADWPARCRVAGSGCGWVLSARLDGGDRRRVVRGRDAHWSPDARTILFTPPDGGVATVAASGAASSFLGRGYQPDWSPTGARIVYSRMRGQTNDIWVMRRDGRGARRIVRGAQTPAWAP